MGRWCEHMREVYRRMQKGMKTNANLSQGRIERLEVIGFQWQINATFEKRCFDLEIFKEEFGHCNVRRSYAGNPSLGQWCIDMNTGYRKMQKGSTPNSNLSQDRIERLEEIGFQWQVIIDYDKTFEKRCRELIAFKEEFGHCDVPQRFANNSANNSFSCNSRDLILSRSLARAVLTADLVALMYGEEDPNAGSVQSSP